MDKLFHIGTTQHHSCIFRDNKIQCSLKGTQSRSCTDRCKEKTNVHICKCKLVISKATVDSRLCPSAQPTLSICNCFCGSAEFDWDLCSGFGCYAILSVWFARHSCRQSDKHAHQKSFAPLLG